MNHAQLIRNTINSYSDFPKVQADMRKIVKYVSSWQRMNLDPIINNEPAKASNPKLDALTAATEAFEASEAYTPAVKADALEVMKSIAAELFFAKAGSLATLKKEQETRYADQPAVLEYLKQVAGTTICRIEECTPQELLELRKSCRA